ncbi:hypothetical protein ACMATS_06460 [Streptoverticillium reticulum]|uniref:hypothetical protein n=1 Tax=Streptoverticillium reticulum TaxID=1433415 RepID=UPI0039BF9320
MHEQLFALALTHMLTAAAHLIAPGTLDTGTAGHLQQVAALVAFARWHGLEENRFVAQRWQTTSVEARRWIAEARRRGLICRSLPQPARPGGTFTSKIVPSPRCSVPYGPPAVERDERMLLPKEVASLLRISVAALANRRHKGQPPYGWVRRGRAGSGVLYPESAVIAYLAELATGEASAPDAITDESAQAPHATRRLKRPSSKR